MSILFKVRQFIRKKLNHGYLPCYVLSRSPYIIFAYDQDFTKNMDSFVAALPREQIVHIFLQLGWQHETEKLYQPLTDIINRLKQSSPNLRIEILANSPKETDIFQSFGITAFLCHQNAFINENKYRILPNVTPSYDAIYIARITPFKRHNLAEKIKSLLLVGDWHAYEADYVRETLSKFPQAKYLRKISSSAVPRYVAKAKCGLCLSREEGAMFVSAEYLLCGKPIVNTPNIGGRDYLFPDFAAITVNEPTPETIADAVAQLAANPPEPEKIRHATIEKMLFYRDILQQRLKQIYQEEGFALPSGDIHLPHKLGLRCTLMPWTHWRHGLRRQN